MGTESEAGWALFLPIGCERGGEAELPVGRTEAPVGCEAGVRGHGGPRAGSGGGAGAGGGPWCGGERAGGGAGPNDRRAWEGPEGGGEGTGPGLGSPEGGGGGDTGPGGPVTVWGEEAVEILVLYNMSGSSWRAGQDASLSPLEVGSSL